ncbi:cysteine-rich secretory protein 3 [Sorex araneus]|uniref:cysteine-rich secretory protein 3 n=1 Tax=Sorex araneus TaxID=42254 RepID=UPI0024340292|nr:cysteine-rich secretory protein 3 [Sorex araneus]
MASIPVLLCFTAVLISLFPENGQGQSIESLSVSLKKIQEEIVNKHNELRRSVSPTASNMLKMKWSKEAAANAQRWADQCTLSHSTQQHREISTSNCGENLFMASYPATWSKAIQDWYDESKDFIYGKGPKTSHAVIGHYTQVVWYSSSLVGCGISYCPNSILKYYFVCQYCPAGNLRSKLHVPYLSGPPCASCPNDCDNGLCTNSCKYIDKYSNCKSLVKTVGCTHDITKDGCQASCKCQDKIY